MMTQPNGWEQRATKLKIGDCSVLVLGLLDLAYNKLEADREKDREFLREAFSTGLLTSKQLRDFIEEHSPILEAKRTMLAVLSSIDTPC